jgi:hypothetical protein
MAFCTVCGSQLDDGTRFCVKCGMAVASEMSAAQSIPAFPAAAVAFLLLFLRLPRFPTRSSFRRMRVSGSGCWRA